MAISKLNVYGYKIDSVEGFSSSTHKATAVNFASYEHNGVTYSRVCVNYANSLVITGNMYLVAYLFDEANQVNYLVRKIEGENSDTFNPAPNTMAIFDNVTLSAPANCEVQVLWDIYATNTEVGYSNDWTPSSTAETYVLPIIDVDENFLGWYPVSESAKAEAVLAVNAEMTADSSAETTLSVVPALSRLEVGKIKKMHILTNAGIYQYEISDENILSYDYSTSALTALQEGTATITFRATAENRDTKEVTLAIEVTKKTSVDLDDFDDEELIENAFYYDENLPISINGTIAYKKGWNTNDPLIKFQFNEETNKWDVIGIKIENYTSNGEAYSLYFLASEAYLVDTLQQATLEDVILAKIDKLFEDNINNMIEDLKGYFIDDIYALINSLIEEAFAGIDERVNTRVEEKIDEVLEEEIEKKLILDKFFFTGTEYCKKTEMPKWSGIIQMWVSSALIYSRRINCMGLDEDWKEYSIRRNEMKNGFYTAGLLRLGSVHYDRDIQKVFDNISIWGNMDKTFWIAGDDLTLLKDEHADNPLWFYTKEGWDGMLAKQIPTNSWYDVPSNTASHEFMPLTKTWYIDVQFQITDKDGNLDSKIYDLIACGEEQFTIDIADYFDNVGSVTFHYWGTADADTQEKIKKLGVFPYEQDGTKITANLHPAFYNYYQADGTLKEPEADGVTIIPDELDYVYLGCNIARLVNSVWYSHRNQVTSTTATGVVTNSYTVAQNTEQYWVSPTRCAQYNYIYLGHLLYTIERGYIGVYPTEFNATYVMKYRGFNANNYIVDTLEAQHSGSVKNTYQHRPHIFTKSVTRLASGDKENDWVGVFAVNDVNGYGNLAGQWFCINATTSNCAGQTRYDLGGGIETVASTSYSQGFLVSIHAAFSYTSYTTVAAI